MTRAMLAILVATLAWTTPAHAEHMAAEAQCDETCIARELALTLTDATHTLSFERLIEFEPGRVRVYSAGRQKIKELAHSWREHRLGAITVEAYAAPSGLVDADAAQALAQRRAERIANYLVRYGVPREMITAVGRLRDLREASDARSVDIRIAPTT